MENLNKNMERIYNFIERKYKIRFFDYMKEVFENKLVIPFEEWRYLKLQKMGFFKIEK